MGLILSEAQVEQYYTNGLLLIEDVFDKPDLLHVRELFLDAFSRGLWKEAPHSDPSIINDIYSYFPDSLDTLFPARFFQVLKDILGEEIVWIPECSIHRNRFIHWHKDTSVQELHGEQSHREYAAPLVQAAIYFQDNDPKTGGGLTVILGSQTLPDSFAPMLSASPLHRIYYKLLKTLRLSSFERAERSKLKVNVPSAVGSLLLFDLRVDHRSTGSKKEKNGVDKLAIFNTFGLDNTTTKDYYRFMKERPEPYYQYFRDKPLHPSVYAKAAEHGITIWY